MAHLVLMGLIANVVPFFLFGWGELRITSGMAGVLNGTTPLFTLIFAMGLLPEERLSTARALGLLTGFAGVVLVVGPWRQDGDNLVTGQLAILGAAACYGIAFTYTRRFISGRARPTPLAAAQLLCGAGLLWLGAPLIPGPVWPNPLDLDATVLGSIGALGVIGTGLAYLLYYRLINDAGATTASMVTYLIPVFAVLLGVLVLDEVLAWNQFAGAAVVILGVALAEGRLGGFGARPAPGAHLEEAAGVDAPTVAPEDPRA